MFSIMKDKRTPSYATYNLFLDVSVTISAAIRFGQSYDPDWYKPFAWQETQPPKFYRL